MTSREPPTSMDTDLGAALRDDDARSLGIEARRARAAVFTALFGPDDASSYDAVEIGRYRVIRPLGRGGMGTVYLVFDPELDREIAVKLLHRVGTTPDDVRAAQARIRREAMAMAKLTDPHVVRIYDVGESGGQVFIAMEYAEGGTLRQWQEASTRSWQELLERYLAAGEGLAAAHRAGLVHRDFKPDNVLIDAEGRAMVSDFGLVRPAEGLSATGAPVPPLASNEDFAGLGERLSTLTQSGVAVGTPAYMAPEQLAGTSDARSDQFSFCVALYEAAGRRHPFERDTLGATLLAAATEQMRPPKPGTMPRWMLKILRRGLRAAPDQRFPDMRTLLGALRQGRRRRGKAVVVASLVGVGAVGVATLSMVPQESPTPADPLCTSTAEQIADAWNPGRRDELRRVLVEARPTEESTLADDALQRLDAYATALQTSHDEFCLAAGSTEPPTREAARSRWLATLCLSWKASEFSGIVDLLRESDRQTLAVAVPLVQDLVAPRSCADPRAIRGMLVVPDDPALQSRVRDLRRELARVHALRQAGRFADAVKLLDALEPTLPPEVPALAALLTFERAQLEVRGGDLGRGLTMLERVALDAQAAGYDELALAASRKRLELAIQDWDYEEAARWRELASVLAERLGDHRSGVIIDLHHGEILLRSGEVDEALATQRRALANAQTHLDPNDPELAHTHDYLAGTLAQLGRFDEAIEHKRRGIELLERSMGRDNVDLTIVLKTTGNVHRMAGRRLEARGFYERALAIVERQLGPDNPRLEQVLATLADWYADEGDFAAAIERYERVLGLPSLGARRTWTRFALVRARMLAGDFQRAEDELAALRPEPPSATWLRIRAELHLERGNAAEARIAARRALEIVRAEPNHDSRLELEPLAVLAWAEAENGRIEDAERALAELRASIERQLGLEPIDHFAAGWAAFQVASARGDDDEIRAAAREALRWAESALGDQHPRRRALAEAAR